MQKKNRIPLIASLIVAMVISACNQASDTDSTSKETDSSTKETIYLGEVTSIKDDTIVLALGTEKEMSEPPASDESNTSKQPEQSPPDNNGSAPSKLDLTGESVEITITDDTKITVENSENSNKGTVSDIEAGDVLSVTCEEDDSNAITVAIESASPGDASMGEGPSDKESIDLSSAYTVDGKEETSDDETFSSSSKDENAILVKNGGSLTLRKATITKSGDTSSANDSNFYGLNSIIAANSGSSITVSDTEMSSDSEGSNGIFATGEGSKITVSNVIIKTTADSARGLDATYGGTIIAKNVEIETEGAHCAALATDRGEGTIAVTEGTLKTAGDGSPCIYSTGNITAEKVTGTATGAQAAVIEGKNSITLIESDLTGSGENGVMLYQSTSGDAAEGTSVLTVKDSILTSNSSGPMFYVTNTTAEVNLTNSQLSCQSDTLIDAAGNETNNWGTPGSNGGILTFKASNQNLQGKVKCDNISSVDLTLKDRSTYLGAIDNDNTGEVSVSLDKNSIWDVADDSYVASLTDEDEKLENINSNGFNIYYDAGNSKNDWLDGKTITLQGGGKLAPVK
ncbi:hypothetical protein IEO70_10215 [Bacillus sp. AGMB 02131]|uniref:Carbohydrate-binding domain-containing protein n=1 Tax=Peribacillus faecalis TaxID=2772559 RepID=A0A927HBQ0_9BACI|nr:hypothetical protein [Peribacillus faecalis]MBD3108741.1 hypothetical protein [Peribacillus faecalis]